MNALVAVEDLVCEFHTRHSSHVAVDHVSVGVAPGGSLGVVGESGSGKTTLVRCMLGLIKPTAGSVTFSGTEVTTMSAKELRAMRGRVGMVFQNPVQALNPRMSVEDIVAEPLRLHSTTRRGELRPTIDGLLDAVGLASAYRDRLPHQLSGGQCQRVGIARALATTPELLILDEPTSALDVSVQAQILNLLSDLRAKRNLTYIMVSHDLDVVRYLAESVVVMFQGRVVEEGTVDAVLSDPQDPYTQRLVAASPSIEGPSLRASLETDKDVHA